MMLAWTIHVRHFSRVITDQNSCKPPTALVFWIIWFAILQGFLIIQFMVGGGIPKGSDQGNPPQLFLLIATSLALAAIVIRFKLIPRLDPLPKKLPAMIIVLALSEGIGMLGMFAVGQEFPATRQALFVTAVVFIGSFAPVYAKSSAGNERV